MSGPIIAGDWIEWAGGKRPIPADVKIKIHARGWDRAHAEQSDTIYAGEWHWSHSNRRSDIVAYRVVQP